jgi:hypothetical protein
LLTKKIVKFGAGTSLEIAASNSNYTIMKKLLHAGASRSDWCYTPKDNFFNTIELQYSEVFSTYWEKQKARELKKKLEEELKLKDQPNTLLKKAKIELNCR